MTSGLKKCYVTSCLGHFHFFISHFLIRIWMKKLNSSLANMLILHWEVLLTPQGKEALQSDPERLEH